MTLSNNPMLRFFEMSRAYGNMEHIFGGPRAFQEKFSQVERVFRLMETVTPPYDLLKQSIRVVQDLNNSGSLIIILEGENFDLPLYHYKQAIDCLDNNRYELCNGEIRNCLEALILEIYERKTGKKTEKYYRAVDRMTNLGFISHEESLILRETKREWNKRGSHPGRSTRPEAENRLQSVTFLSRFCLYKIMNTPEGSPTIRIIK